MGVIHFMTSRNWIHCIGGSFRDFKGGSQNLDEMQNYLSGYLPLQVDKVQ